MQVLISSLLYGSCLNTFVIPEPSASFCGPASNGPKRTGSILRAWDDALRLVESHVRCVRIGQLLWRRRPWWSVVVGHIFCTVSLFLLESALVYWSPLGLVLNTGPTSILSAVLNGDDACRIRLHKCPILRPFEAIIETSFVVALAFSPVLFWLGRRV